MNGITKLNETPTISLQLMTAAGLNKVNPCVRVCLRTR